MKIVWRNLQFLFENYSYLGKKEPCGSRHFRVTRGNIYQWRESQPLKISSSTVGPSLCDTIAFTPFQFIIKTYLHSFYISFEGKLASYKKFSLPLSVHLGHSYEDRPKTSLKSPYLQTYINLTLLFGAQRLNRLIFQHT